MGTLTATIEARREADYDRSVEFEYERRRLNEITGASERIATPMRNEFQYTMGPDGHLWFKGENIGILLDQTIVTNEQVVKYQSQFITELIRNHIEREEYDQQRKLALGSDDDPDILVVLSPIPDAVVAGADLGAYDKSRMKTMVRVYERSEDGIRATSLSLDLSDRQGLQAIARKFGQTIDDDATSEDILSMRFWAHSSCMDDETVTTVRKLYDTELSRQYGGKWFAGRQDSKVLDAMVFVESQADLLKEHMSIVNGIFAKTKGESRISELKKARYNFAAALTRRLRGDRDASSIGEAGDAARANGEEYNSDCPEGTTATQALNELMGKNKNMTCPFCGLMTYGDPCASRLVCSKCAAEVKDGRVISSGIGRQNALALQRITHEAARSEVIEAEYQNREEFAKAVYGENIQLRYEIGLGSAAFVAYDLETNEALGKL